jgi:hypothetical protein
MIQLILRPALIRSPGAAGLGCGQQSRPWQREALITMAAPAGAVAAGPHPSSFPLGQLGVPHH